MIWCGITQDRTQLFATGNLHRSLWYFDPQREEQLQAALVAEYNCVRDLCRTDESLQAVGEYLHVHPYYILPAFGSRLDWTFSNSAIQQFSIRIANLNVLLKNQDTQKHNASVSRRDSNRRYRCRRGGD